MRPDSSALLVAGALFAAGTAMPVRAVDLFWSLNTPVELPGAPAVEVVRVNLTQTAAGVEFYVIGAWPSGGFFGTSAFLGELEFTFSGAALPTLSNPSGSYIAEGGTFSFGADNNDFGFDFALNIGLRTSNNPQGGRFDADDNLSFRLDGTTLSQFTTKVSGPGNSGALDALALGHLQSLSEGASARYVAVTAVPEPATYGMLLAGLGLLGWFARRR